MTLAEFEAFVAEWNNASTTNEDVLAIKDAVAYKEGIEELKNLYTAFSA